MSSQQTEQCPHCECDLVHGHDRMGYEMFECPGCGRWKRPSWDNLRMPNEGEVIE